MTNNGNSFRYQLSDFITFQDSEVCEKVRQIDKSELAEHSNSDLQINIIEEPGQFYAAFAIDIVSRIKEALNNDNQFVAILPVGPVPQYEIAARMINELKLPMHHVHTFNMDEYANEDGETAPITWEGSFKKAMLENFFNKIDENLRPPEEQIHFPSSDNIDHYDEMVEELGGADVCYGGIGWCGHIAFWESHLGLDFIDNIKEYKQQHSKIVKLHPMTIMQNALHSFGGDWSWVPPKAASIGPNLIMGAKHRSFWLDGYIGGGVSWQRFIARLVLHGPVTPLVPGSILQTDKGDINILGQVAENVEIHMA